MNRIEEMIKRLCPKGVESVKLGDYIILYTGEQLNKANMFKIGSYPVINGGVSASGFVEAYNEQANTITISQGGASAGYVNFLKVPFWAGAHCFVIKPNSDNLNKRFLYHYIKGQEFFIQQCQQGAGIPSVNSDKIKKLLIPLPPLSIQQEIVSVLDSFTTLIDKMKKEVELRKKQMEVYREKLFTFKDNECDWKEIQEIFNMRNGYTPSKSKSNYWEGGNVPWFRMEDIRENGHVLSDSILHITMDGVKNGRLFPANSFILATTATIGEHALIIADSLANQRFTNLSIRKSLKEKLLTKFVFHYLFIVDDWCKNNVNISGFASVDMGRFKKYMFPIPPLSRQQEIIRTLDTFEAYISKLEKLITLRQKQYEYNREKLLTFE